MKLPRVGIIGAGMAGAACARLLVQAGCEVLVHDKSRGVGGRMATRRASMGAGEDPPRSVQFDHGAPWWTTGSAGFDQLLNEAQAAGVVQRWTPRSLGPAGAPAPLEPGWLAVPDMPALSRWMLQDAQHTLSLRTDCAVDALNRQAGRWQAFSAQTCVADDLDAMVLAIPAPQAAALLQDHQPAWAERAKAHPMSPCWTLMAITEEPAAAAPGPMPEWDILQPVAGPLSLVVRQDTKPGRTAVPGQACWVAHADSAWSQLHLESDPAEVRPALQRALEQVIMGAAGKADAVGAAIGAAGDRPPQGGSGGAPLRWHHAVVHRWRYAQAGAAAPRALEPCWWDASAGLGACGDFLGGGGVQGAWLSGQALALAVARSLGRTTAAA